MKILKMIESHPEMVPKIQEAVLHCLKVYAKSSISPKHAVFNSQKQKMNFKVLGVINLTNVNQKGALAIGLSEQSILKIYENMFGEKVSSISQSILELPGEMANIIFQTIDPELRKMGYELHPSLPKNLMDLSLEKWLMDTSGTSLMLFFTMGSEEICFQLVELNDSMYTKEKLC